MFWWLTKLRRSIAGRTPTAARARARHATSKLSTELGSIADLSADGMRIICPVRPLLAVNDTDTWFVGNCSQRVKVTGRIAWIERERLNQWQVGVQFLDLDPAKRFALDLLARKGFLQPGSHNVKDLDPESLELLRAAQAAKASWESGVAAEVQTPAGSASTDQAANPSAGTATGLSARVHVEDLYAILDIPRDATEAQIKAAFRAIALQHHPDHATSPASAELFVRANKAYSILRDRELRLRYDDMLKHAA